MYICNSNVFKNIISSELSVAHLFKIPYGRTGPPGGVDCKASVMNLSILRLVAQLFEKKIIEVEFRVCLDHRTKV
jgi:hypothetical protein